MQKNIIFALGILLSIHHGAHARYLKYDTVIQVTAKLKTLGKDTTTIEAFEKEFPHRYFGLIRPREYNKLYALLLSFLATAEYQQATHKVSTQQDDALQILEMIDNELKGLINKYGYRKEFIGLSYRTTKLRSDLTKSSILYPIYSAGLKREAQDLLAEALLTETISEQIEKRVKTHLRKIKEKDQKKEEPKENKESQDPSKSTDVKPE